jgi:hypothetical protein
VKPAIRRGVLDGLLVSAVAVAVLVLSNVVFPAGPDESDDDPEYVVQILAGYLLIAAVLVVIGLRARRRAAGAAGGVDARAGVLGGAAAGLVMALAVLVASLVIDNVFLATVSQQHDKRVAFEASGWTSMRTYLNIRTLLGALVVLPAATLAGGLLGGLGGLIRRPPQDSAAPLSWSKK